MVVLVAVVVVVVWDGTGGDEVESEQDTVCVDIVYIRSRLGACIRNRDDGWTGSKTTRESWMGGCW
jgi:hypothetical protein